MTSTGAKGRPGPVRLPFGVSDYPPGRAAALDSYLSGFHEVFDRHGYQRVYTPWFELEESLERGLGAGIKATVFRLVDPASGEVLVLRPDFTAQVARMVGSRLARSPRPLRLAYHGRVARAADPQGRGLSSRDLFQAGVELIGVPGPEAELEVLRLVARAFARVGRPVTLDLSHAGILAALVEGDLTPDARRALAAKDAVALARLAPALLPLVDLYGGPEVIPRAQAVLKGAPAPVHQALEALLATLAALARVAPEVAVSLDLAEARGFGYYTGLSFRGYVEGAPDAVAIGGRYDRLLESFGAAEAAVGFGVDVGRLLLDESTPPRRGVVIGASTSDPGAEAEADRRRALGEPAVLVAPDQAEGYAQHHGFRAWLRFEAGVYVERPVQAVGSPPVRTR